MDPFLDPYATLLLPLLHHSAADSILPSLHYATLPLHGRLLGNCWGWWVREGGWGGVTLPVVSQGKWDCRHVSSAERMKVKSRSNLMEGRRRRMRKERRIVLMCFFLPARRMAPPSVNSTLCTHTCMQETPSSTPHTPQRLHTARKHSKRAAARHACLSQRCRDGGWQQQWWWWRWRGRGWKGGGHAQCAGGRKGEWERKWEREKEGKCSAWAREWDGSRESSTFGFAAAQEAESLKGARRDLSLSHSLSSSLPLPLLHTHAHVRHALVEGASGSAGEAPEEHAHRFCRTLLRFGELSLEDWTQSRTFLPQQPLRTPPLTLHPPSLTHAQSETYLSEGGGPTATKQPSLDSDPLICSHELPPPTSLWQQLHV